MRFLAPKTLSRHFLESGTSDIRCMDPVGYISGTQSIHKAQVSTVKVHGPFGEAVVPRIPSFQSGSEA